MVSNMGFIKRGDAEQIKVIKKDEDDADQVNKEWAEVRKEAKKGSEKTEN